MTKKIFIHFLICLILFTFCFNIVLAEDATGGRQNLKNQQSNIELMAEFAGINLQADITLVIASIIKALLGLVGIIFVTLFIYAGFTYMTSGGVEEKITKAKKLMKNAVIGLVIIMTAYAIASFIAFALESA